MESNLKSVVYSRIDGTPLLAQALGRYIAHFGQIERTVASAFCRFAHFDEQAAAVVCRHIISMQGKMDLLLELAEAYIKDEGYLERLKEMIKQVRGLSSTRDMYAHAGWMDHSQDNTAKIDDQRKNNKAQSKIIRVEDIEQDIEEVLAVQREFRALLAEIIGKKSQAQPQSASRLTPREL
jgi:hypothetical protein